MKKIITIISLVLAMGSIGISKPNNNYQHNDKRVQTPNNFKTTLNEYKNMNKNERKKMLDSMNKDQIKSFRKKHR
ncbi:hypothetical protein [Francisella adeliensis]|uniref:Uncharacterized protein n=1 Tax=Francisella adeliensis TaxID=2007306 RepID=A0A2Z4XZ22_9GAMM|nr:hypothetical protein [Francisella adeliensis]AXA33732.1 hypothetical protein CDH04_04585 [Francisella adeliensis]MBK2085628.1 hypothetical protein [Francisella adeliensis]MBK2097506.1 hypothetical protein [Francisella adeliensis]QIW11966.1 hypothetical protein FZC43_04590 [Francisella adeliensis]QIW13842.1 hypothetical protein FZC44_04590 [Francisella adeliensis]